MYYVEFAGLAKNQLKKFDRHTAGILLSWIRKRLEGAKNPRAFGKSLVSGRSGEWCYRFGAYRILEMIEDARVVILMLGVGYRSGA